MFKREKIAVKSHTDIEQSKRLAEFLPLESADMYYTEYDTDYADMLYGPCDIRYFNIRGWTPAWSLTALLGVIRKTTGYEMLCLDGENITIKCELGDEPWSIEINKDNEVDACYETILKLNELGIL